ncbi:syntenihypothetical protein [Limosa lapponica baueri]|uniref:PDZ domain-containing protein n=1 Tax=Limosa lapponica baueri TaxID=1758121 RepID=A0A2I0T5M9_LIMLA|nr:syntenihypothetical protein [Limosa lapponica baueri]
MPLKERKLASPSVCLGIFVQLVQANSPASLAGLRFGDQVLQINGENCAGWSSDKAHKVLKQASGERISMIIRDSRFVQDNNNQMPMKWYCRDPQIADILATAGNVVTITIMPSSIYEYIIKRMATSIMKSLMDHSVPEV